MAELEKPQIFAKPIRSHRQLLLWETMVLIGGTAAGMWVMMLLMKAGWVRSYIEEELPLSLGQWVTECTWSMVWVVPNVLQQMPLT